MKLRLKTVLMAAAFAGGAALAQGNGGGPWQASYALEAAGSYAQAAAALVGVLRDRPNDDFALMRRGWLGYLQGRYGESIRDYNQALAANPQSLEARLGLSLPLMAQQRWKEAEIELRKIVAVSSWDYTAHTRLLACEDGQRKWDEMARHAAELAARFPSDATALVYGARAQAGLGNVRKAKAAYAQVLDRVPGHIEATNYLKANP